MRMQHCWETKRKKKKKKEGHMSSTVRKAWTSRDGFIVLKQRDFRLITPSKKYPFISNQLQSK
jgi:hypothetical protein